MFKEIGRTVRNALADWNRTLRLVCLLVTVAAIASWLIVLKLIVGMAQTQL